MKLFFIVLTAPSGNKLLVPVNETSRLIGSKYFYGNETWVEVNEGAIEIKRLIDAEQK